ncbi:AAA family ATPase [Halosquirtibacter laminarini]|uniref:AAA family ATPase n=1 Tax=Halosquirtibacter laminarini TaxID=3374600 RepID=A0AC61NHH3_9BACT|nr:AAA family ATPase [Prolixibacteraceae bacterium]
MSKIFISQLHINKLLSINDTSIDVSNSQLKHLIITGKNGSGKTMLLNSIMDFFRFDCYEAPHVQKNLDDRLYLRDKLNIGKLDHKEQKKIKSKYDEVFSRTSDVFRTLEVHMIPSMDESFTLVESGKAIFTMFSANRRVDMLIPKNPIKPSFVHGSSFIKDHKQSKEFVKFLVDLKVQEALARNEGEIKEADKIRDWFTSFTDLLKRLFEDQYLKLNFDFRTYQFTIHSEDKVFGFNELSDGYSAVIDIIADLILAMQNEDGSLNGIYDKPGIVLIDEVETHLHLKLQKEIMPFLTTVFPNIQFIVTTHSPFVLSSLDNAVAYDLEKKQKLTDLQEYSYESLTEGYFKVKTESSYLGLKLKRVEELLKLETKDKAQDRELKELIELFDNLNHAVTPDNVIAKYNKLLLRYL